MATREGLQLTIRWPIVAALILGMLTSSTVTNRAISYFFPQDSGLQRQIDDLREKLQVCEEVKKLLMERSGLSPDQLKTMRSRPRMQGGGEW